MGFLGFEARFGVIVAFRRYGFPGKVLRLIERLYAERRFAVRDGHNQSSSRQQGCPLSPLPFIMAMSVIVGDATSMLAEREGAQLDDGSLSMLLYAHDTLLMGSSAQSLQHLFDAVAEVGHRFGMDLHWNKFQLVQVGRTYVLQTPDGAEIPPADSMCISDATCLPMVVCILSSV